MYRKILVPTDGSPVSEAAVEAAVALCRADGSELLVLSVGQPRAHVPSVEGAMVSDFSTESEQLLDEANDNVQRAAKMAAAASVRCTTRTAVAHSPDKEILETAAREHCDLILMGSHGRRGLSRLLAGSVAQNVLAYAQVPVMILRPAPQSMEMSNP